MNFKSLSNKVRPSVETEATAQEQDFIIEELSDEEAAAVCGGKKPTTSTDSDYWIWAPASWSGSGLG